MSKSQTFKNKSISEDETKYCSCAEPNSKHNPSTENENFCNDNMEIPEIYKNFEHIPYCRDCQKFIDYKNMPIGYFWDWLEKATKYSKDPDIKGKAIIRYFELDRLLGQQSKGKFEE